MWKARTPIRTHAVPRTALGAHSLPLTQSSAHITATRLLLRFSTRWQPGTRSCGAVSDRVIGRRSATRPVRVAPLCDMAGRPMYVHAITDFICCAGLMFFIVRFRRNQVINRKDIELRNITAPERPRTPYLPVWLGWLPCRWGCTPFEPSLLWPRRPWRQGRSSPHASGHAVRDCVTIRSTSKGYRRTLSTCRSSLTSSASPPRPNPLKPAPP